MTEINKDELRKKYLALRRELSPTRRDQAKANLDQLIEECLQGKKVVLSYAPLSEEVDVKPINEKLASLSMLALPRMEDHHIKPYMVKNIETDLEKGKRGFLEPRAEKATPAENIGVALVPGLVFDQFGNRIGFGFGHYDHFLNGNTTIHTIGVAFKEQIHPERLVLGEHDIPMDKMYIV